MVDVIGMDDKYRYRVTHDKCGHILEYTEFEVIEDTYRDLSGCSEKYELIICPKCFPIKITKQGYVEHKNQIPSSAKVEVTNRKRK